MQDSKGTQIESVTDIAELPDGTFWMLSRGVIYELKQNILTKHTEVEFQMDRLTPLRFFLRKAQKRKRRSGDNGDRGDGTHRQTAGA